MHAVPRLCGGVSCSGDQIHCRDAQCGKLAGVIINPEELQVTGLIVESGFAYAGPLLQLMGIDLTAMGYKEDQGFGNIDKIKEFRKPTLIIHAEYDHIIPFSDGLALYEACPSDDKAFLKIPGANHNDIFMRGLQQYLAAVRKLVETAKRMTNVD